MPCNWGQTIGHGIRKQTVMDWSTLVDVRVDLVGEIKLLVVTCGIHQEKIKSEFDALSTPFLNLS